MHKALINLMAGYVHYRMRWMTSAATISSPSTRLSMLRITGRPMRPFVGLGVWGTRCCDGGVVSAVGLAGWPSTSMRTQVNALWFIPLPPAWEEAGRSAVCGVLAAPLGVAMDWFQLLSRVFLVFARTRRRRRRRCKASAAVN